MSEHPADPQTSFTAQVKLAGINPFVDAPEHAVKALGGGAKIAANFRF